MAMKKLNPEKPNEHARPLSLEVNEKEFLVNGYQHFMLKRNPLACFPLSDRLVERVELLEPWLNARALAQKLMSEMGQ